MFAKLKTLSGLEEKVKNEIYHLIDKHMRPLPKKSDGTFDEGSGELQDNDVDALEYNAIVANVLGYLRELSPGNNSLGRTFRQEGRRRNMDLWNNAVGRKYGKISKTREELFQHLLKALESGELIIDLNDSREYSSKTDLGNGKIKERVIVLKESETGENILFLDTQTLLIFSREDFVAKIKSGEYGKEYEIRVVDGKEIPASKRDGTLNLG